MKAAASLNSWATKASAYPPIHSAAGSSSPRCTALRASRVASALSCACSIVQPRNLALRVAPSSHAIGAGQVRVELDRLAKELERLAVRVLGPPTSASQP